MTTAYLGLGTNLGERWANLRDACQLLASEPGLGVVRSSKVYETEPWGVAEQPKFLNCALEISTTLRPEPLLVACKNVEKELGRRPGVRWGPRLIDVDILLYGGDVVKLPHLEIPHPRLHLRTFALLTLADVAPDAVHPSLGTTIGELATGAEGKDGVTGVGELDWAG